jgi:hypothetical protein
VFESPQARLPFSPGFSWALTSILEARDFQGRLEKIREKWRYNTRQKLERGDLKIFGLLIDPQYKFLTVLPDGVYGPKKFTIDPFRIE